MYQSVDDGGVGARSKMSLTSGNEKLGGFRSKRTPFNFLKSEVRARAVFSPASAPSWRAHFTVACSATLFQIFL